MNNMYDINIYGLGPASVFFVHKLINSNLKIAIHEMGNFSKVGTINNIDKLKGPFFFNKKERSKAVFGAASLWKTKGVGGHLFYFDKEDLKRWPISYSEICKNYKEVIKKIEYSTNQKISEDYKKKNILKHINLSNLNKSLNLKLGSGTLKFSFTKLYDHLVNDIKKSKNITVFTNSRLIRFEYDYSKGKILHSIVKQSKRTKFFSKIHVLACGCLESNRLILQTFKKEKKFIKKYNIGKYISFHPTLNLGEIKPQKKIFVKENHFKRILIMLKPNKTAYMNSGISLSMSYLKSKTLIGKIIDSFERKVNHINVGLLIEHKTNKKNYITLSKKKYTNTDFKININTFFEKKNFESVKKMSEKFSNYLSSQKNFIFKRSKDNILFETNNHHHGGLCFGKNKRSTVDSNFKLKKFNNLYICGSSLFPSSSCYGPTLTIMAISNLLGSKIKKKFNVK